MDEKQEKSITSRVKHRQTVITKLLQRIIDHCGYLTFNIRDDAFYFALTKATRSMKAARILYDNGYYEDAIILTRTAYEAYLYAAFAYNLDNEDNEVAWDLVRTPASIALGVFDRKANIVKNLKTGEERSFRKLTIADLAKRTNNGILDNIVHKHLYVFLCENSHINMVALGNYRVEDPSIDFKYQPNHNEYPAVLFVLTYVALLFLGEIVRFEDLDHLAWAAKRQVVYGLKDQKLFLESFSSAKDPLGIAMWNRAKVTLDDYLEWYGDFPLLKTEKKVEMYIRQNLCFS